MIKTQTTTIGGVRYTVQQLPVTRALRLSAKLGGILAPALAKASKSVAGTNLDNIAGLDISLLGDALETLMMKMTPDELEFCTKELLYVLEKDGKDISRSFDTEFCGELLTVFKLLRFAFEVNFGDFFDAARGWQAKLRAVPAPSSSQA